MNHDLYVMWNWVQKYSFVVYTNSWHVKDGTVCHVHTYGNAPTKEMPSIIFYDKICIGCPVHVLNACICMKNHFKSNRNTVSETH